MFTALRFSDQPENLNMFVNKKICRLSVTDEQANEWIVISSKTRTRERTRNDLQETKKYPTTFYCSDSISKDINMIFFSRGDCTTQHMFYCFSSNQHDELGSNLFWCCLFFSTQNLFLVKSQIIYFFIGKNHDESTSTMTAHWRMWFSQHRKALDSIDKNWIIILRSRGIDVVRKKNAYIY